MLHVGPRSPRLAIPAWLAIASLVPAQNSPETLPDPEPAVEETAKEAPKLPEPQPSPDEAEKTEDPKASQEVPKLPEPTTPPADPDLSNTPTPEMKITPGESTPALPAPTPPPAGSENLVIPGAPTLPGIPGAPVMPLEGNPSLPGEFPTEPGIPGTALLPGTGQDLLPSDMEGTLPDPDVLETEEDPLLGGHPEDSLFGSQESGDTPNPMTPESPFRSDIGQFGFEEEEKEGFAFAIELTESYSSNLELREDDPESTLYTTLSPGFNYRSALSGRAINTITADYLSNLNFYHDNQIDDTIGHDLKAVYTHRGNRALIELRTAFNRETDSSRFTNALTESTNLSATLDFAYRATAKTAIYASAEYTTRENNISTRGDSDLFSASVSALWDYTAKLDIGPSLRYAQNTSGATGDSESTTLGMEARYAHSKKLKFVLNGGAEASTYNNEDTEYSPAASLRATYTPSSIWKFTGDLRYQAIPISELNSETFGNPFLGGGFSDLNGAAAGGGQQINGSLGVVYSPGDLWRVSSTLSHRTAPSFLNANESLVDTALNFRVMRQIGESIISARYAYSLTAFESDTGLTREDQLYHTFGVDYNHPNIFKELSLRAGIGYALSSGSRDYDQTTASVIFGYRF